jgi:glutamine---fructose-6-phosphate transaminase (isomerizing)
MLCHKCILPDTIPGIYFNEKGECNYCQENFPSYLPKGDEALAHLLSKNLSKNSSADCLVGLSGGKDSTYSLIMLKEKFAMRVEAFTYVHEGSTAFSIKNAKRTCEELGIKHHIVSLDKQYHLKTFVGFFQAWLKSPSPATAGMTCVACKHLHILGLNIAKERNIPMIVWSTSPLEYSPFLALKYKGNDKNQFKRESNFKGTLLLMKELSKTKEFPKTFFTYFNICFFGCLAAFPTSNYLKKKYHETTPVFFYDYHNWDPKQIKKYIEKTVNWQIPDGREDWHSDCLFNVFKEYMFQSMFGASYSDAFFSNQIRHGLISRNEALCRLKEGKKRNKVDLVNALNVLHLQQLENLINLKVFSANEI